jgi:hypothetical protein
MTKMGPHHQIKTRSRTRERAKHSLVGSGTGGVGRVHQGTRGNRAHLTLKITLGHHFSFLLRENEGWKIKARPELLEVELSYHNEPISTSVDL